MGSGSALQAQSYCIPPAFQTGPFTGLTNVTLGDLDNSSAFDVGYFYYEDATVPQLEQGKSYDISVTTLHDILGVGFSDKLNVVAYIDWNQDGDFSDANEEAMVWMASEPGVITGTINIPANAVLGNTRMRIYEDMPSIDGHESPNPCGYNTGIGQHGEVEDYDIEIIEAVAPIGIAALEGSAIDLQVLSGAQAEDIVVQYQLSQAATVQLQVYDLVGRTVYQSAPVSQATGQQSLPVNLSAVTSGQVYLLHLTVNDQRFVQKIIK